ncbi:MAG: hypothetical protein ABL958_10385 [Bdellovibrionia bacterium]
MIRIVGSLLLIGLGIAVAMPTPASAESAIEKFALSTCKNEGRLRCLKATASKAEGGSLKPIYVLRNLEVTLVDSAKSEKTVTVSERGYLDFETNRLVLDTKNGEKVFNLSDLSVNEWKLK